MGDEDKTKEYDAVLAMNALKTQIDDHQKVIKGHEDTIIVKDKEIKDWISKHDSIKTEYDTYKSKVERDNRVAGHFESATKQGLVFDDERKKDLKLRFERWSSEDSEAYITDLAKVQSELKTVTEKVSVKEPEKTPEPAKASKIPKPSELEPDSQTQTPKERKPSVLSEKFMLFPKID